MLYRAYRLKALVLGGLKKEGCITHNSVGIDTIWINEAGKIHNDLLDEIALQLDVTTVRANNMESVILDITDITTSVLCSKYGARFGLTRNEAGILPVIMQYGLSLTKYYSKNSTFPKSVNSELSTPYKSIYRMLWQRFDDVDGYLKNLEEVRSRSEKELRGLEKSVMLMAVSVGYGSRLYWENQLSMASSSPWSPVLPSIVDDSIARSNPPRWVYADLRAAGAAMTWGLAAVWIPGVGQATAAGIIGGSAVASAGYAIADHFGFSFP